jgi:O-antigen/teichoic acid export membrane protein
MQVIGNKVSNIELKGSKRITFGAVANYLNIILGFINGILIIPLISKKLGTDNYGLFILSNSLISLLLIDFGLSTTTNTFISKLRAKGKEDEIPVFAGCIIKIYLLIDLLILTIEVFFFLFLNKIYIGLTGSQLSTLKILFIISALFSLVSFPTTPFIGILNSYERFAWNTIADIIQKLLYFVICFLVLFVYPSIVLITIASCASGLASIFIKFLMIKKLGVRFKLKNTSIAKSYYKQIFNFTVWSAIISIFWRLFKFLGPTILGIVSNAEQISIFGIASEIETYAFMLCGAISGFFLPKIARALEIKDEKAKNDRLQNLATTVSKIIISLFLLILFGFVMF